MFLDNDGIVVALVVLGQQADAGFPIELALEAVVGSFELGGFLVDEQWLTPVVVQEEHAAGR
ncbi:MAG: hypothetical protein EP330_02530 [Deltaproteobacteria bacterium]|nr:MAG: hypothetical protein EP330_02530 [Deltaproteobacteria bacterium]